MKAANAVFILVAVGFVDGDDDLDSEDQDVDDCHTSAEKWLVAYLLKQHQEDAP